MRDEGWEKKEERRKKREGRNEKREGRSEKREERRKKARRKAEVGRLGTRRAREKRQLRDLVQGLRDLNAHGLPRARPAGLVT